MTTTRKSIRCQIENGMAYAGILLALAVAVGVIVNAIVP